MKRGTHRLGDVVDFFDYMRIPVSTLERETMQGNYPYYGAQGIIDNVNDYIFDGEYVLIAEDGANLLTRNQPVAQIARGKFWVNNHAHVVCAKGGISTNYFINALINSMNLTGYVTGVAQPKLSQKNLRMVNVQLPSFSEQQRIAAILSTYDDLIENNQRRIQLLEQSARLLYKEWFVHLRFPGHEHTAITNGVPEGWEKGVISDLGKIVTGKTPSKKRDSYYGEHIPFIKTPDMHGNSVVIKAEDSLSEEGATSQGNKTLPSRSILVSCIGTVGVVSFNGSPAQTNQQINAIIPRTDALRYWSFFMAEGLKTLLAGMGGGATMVNVNKAKFATIPVLIPSKMVLGQFQSIVSPNIDQIEWLAVMNEKLAGARDGFLPRLMNGKVTV